MTALLASPAQSADSRTADALLSRMEAAEKDIKTVRFSFTQKTLVKITGEEQTLEGKASFRRPDRFRLEHLAPRPLTAVSDGKSLWIYNPRLNQVMTDRWENWAASAGFPKGLVLFQENPSDLRRKYDVSLSSGNALTLVPKDPGAWPYTVRVKIDDATGLPLRTELESETLKTATDVRGLEINVPMTDDLFTFKAPRGAEVFGPPAKDGAK